MSPLRRSPTSFFFTLKRQLSFGGLAVCFLLVTASCVSSSQPASYSRPQPAANAARSPVGQGEQPQGCPAAREYIATDKFLASQKVYQLEAKEREAIADRVSSGCQGSAQRFASTVRLLTAAGLGLNNAIEAGVELARTDDKTADGFKQVFSRCYLKEHLDLDLLNCLKVAKWLSLTGEGTIQPDNFVKVVRYCTKGNKLKLSHARCAKLALRLAKVPFNTPRYSAADSFASLFTFLTAKDGPNLSAIKAMKLAEFLASHSPSSAENYRVAYDFAKRSKDATRAHNFALALAKKLPKRKVIPAD